MRSPAKSKRQTQSKKHFSKSPVRPHHRSLPEQTCFSPQSVHRGLFTQAECSLRPCKRSICFLYRRRDAAESLMQSGGRAGRPHYFLNSKKKSNCSLPAIPSTFHELLRMLQVPLRCVLVGPRQREHFSFTEKFSNKRQAGRVSLFVETLRHHHTGMAREVGHGSVHVSDGIWGVVAIVK